MNLAKRQPLHKENVKERMYVPVLGILLEFLCGEERLHEAPHVESCLVRILDRSRALREPGAHWLVDEYH